MENTKQSKWDNFKHFIYENFWKTPTEKIETVVEILLLAGGGSRTISFFLSMGQSSYMAMFGLIYAELLIPIYEWMGIKGKRISKKKKTWFSRNKEVDVYPIFNQKNVSKFGLIVHLGMTVLFTVSDLLYTNLKAAVGNSFDMEANFAYMLGFAVGTAFLLDLICILLYKANDPEFIHKQLLDQIEHEILNTKMQVERDEKVAKMEYQREHAKEFGKLRAEFDARTELLNEYEGKLGKDFISKKLGMEEFNENNNNEPRQKRTYKKRNKIQNNVPQENPTEETGWEEEDDWGSEVENNNQENFPKSQNSENIP